MKLHHIIAATLLIAPAALFAQDQPESMEQDGVVYLAPLFEYPSAPEELESMEAKCTWLAENFWNQMDLKSKDPVDQAKLNHAFGVYVTACQYAPKVNAEQSVDKLLKALQKNPTLLLQFTKAAEENIYGPRADVWIDELYVKFLKAAVATKKIPEARKARWNSQLRQLQGTLVGEKAPGFGFVRADGDKAEYFPMSTPTIIIFGDPECDDCRQGRLRMEANVSFAKAVTDGKINVLFIIPDADEGWQKQISGFPKAWTIGASDSVSDIYDIRVMPDIYVIDSDGKIAEKHINHLGAMNKALSLVNNQQGK